MVSSKPTTPANDEDNKKPETNPKKPEPNNNDKNNEIWDRLLAPPRINNNNKTKKKNATALDCKGCLRRGNGIQIIESGKNPGTTKSATNRANATNPQQQQSQSSFFKLLCLHDENSNSLELRNHLKDFGDKLYANHGIDLVFVDAPLIVAATDKANEEETERIDRQQKEHRGILPPPSPPRAWWQETITTSTITSSSPSSKDDSEQKPQQSSNDNHESPQRLPKNDDSDNNNPRLVGLDASLQWLQQVWNNSEEAPFWGILAFGQQASGIASLLPLLSTTAVPSVCVFVHGHALLPEEESLIDHLPQLQCLHMVDDGTANAASALIDGTIEPQSIPTTAIPSSLDPKRLRLVRQYPGKTVTVPNITNIKTSSSSIFNNHLGRFLVSCKKQELRDQKRRLRQTTALRTTNDDETGDELVPSSSSNDTVLTLRHALHEKEQEALRFITKQWKEQPPPMLLAVVTPRVVYPNHQQQQPLLPKQDKDGGGAPCPFEFVLPRDQRITNNNNAQQPSTTTKQ